jgi:xanthine/CO dehydrogenase XdhC/CoxF family maturation factor/CTP:molybdopterin cytidylyltransferase MocA
MTELVAIAHEAGKLRAQGRTFLLATVVRAHGSSYRRPGARMLVALGETGQEERWLAGCVSGGCLEKDVLLRGAWRTSEGASLVTYDSTTDDEVGWGFGLGCNGVVDVLLERIAPNAALDPTQLFARCLQVSRPGALVTVFASTRPAIPIGAHLAIDPDGASQTTIVEAQAVEALRPYALDAAKAPRPTAEVLEVAGLSVLVETIAPPPHLFVVGTNHDALPLAALAQSMAWKVTVCDTSARHARRFECPLIGEPATIRAAVDDAHDAHVVVMTHDYDRDRDLLRELLDSRARYLGVLGPAHRTDRILSELGASERRQRLYAPVGLDLGAETPQEIALAIVAEIQAKLRAARAGSLRERATSIHAREKVVCAVLAAGASTRLGRPKQLVSFRGEPLVRSVTRAALASACERVAVIVGAEPSVEAALHELPVQCVANPAWQEGIASSVRAAVAWAREQRAAGLVLVLADQPLLSSEHVDRLLFALRAGAPAAGSRYGDVLGVPAAFASSKFDDLAALQGDRGATRLLGETEQVVTISWPQGYLDVDSESDVRALARLEDPSGAVKAVGFR